MKTLTVESKRDFNPENREDMLEYQYFLEHGTWKTVCPFDLEWPFRDITSLINSRIVKYATSSANLHSPNNIQHHPV